MGTIHFIGGEKGGVGKSVLARLMAQYFIDHKQPFSVFDGDQSHGAMLRFYGEFAQPVDMSKYESADRIAEPLLEDGRDVIVDLPAQSAKALGLWMTESGLAELADEEGFGVTLWHLLDDGSDSVRLLGQMLQTHRAEPDYVIVRNFGRGDDFALFEASEERDLALSLGAAIIDLPRLHAATMRKIDHTGSSFWAAANNRELPLGLLERRRVKVWVERAYAQLNRVLIPAVLEPDEEIEIDGLDPAEGSATT